jgi:hypothetical protein
VPRFRVRVALSAAVAMLASVGFATVVVAAPAQASTPHCTSSKFVFTDSFYEHRVPSVASSNSHACTLSYGDEGEGVRTLQWVLNKCNGADLTIDRKFGSATKSALQKAQRDSGVEDDGIYGSDTRAAILWAKYRDGGFAGCRWW